MATAKWHILAPAGEHVPPRWVGPAGGEDPDLADGPAPVAARRVSRTFYDPISLS